MLVQDLPYQLTAHGVKKRAVQAFLQCVAVLGLIDGPPCPPMGPNMPKRVTFSNILIDSYCKDTATSRPLLLSGGRLRIPI
jgi:hypothetical protein